MNSTFFEFITIIVHVSSFHFSNPQTTHQFYLQLREDILRGQLYCHEEASFNLGGLALQAETGDYNGALGDEYFLAEHYVPNKVQIVVSFVHYSYDWTKCAMGNTSKGNFHPR